MKNMTEQPDPEFWSASLAPEAPDHWWVDDDTGEYVNTRTGERMTADEGKRRIKLELT